METWIPNGHMKPEVTLDSDGNTVGPRTISVETTDSLLPGHISPHHDWLADLEMAFASSICHDAALPSNGMLRFADFKSILEPRPIELMIKK
jgi:hypothetical protein